MSTQKDKEIFGFGDRLTEERLRLGFSQKALAAILEKTSMTQIKYESEETRPDIAYLLGLDKLGADIYYIVTGQRSENNLAKDELEILNGYRSLDDRAKRGVSGMIHGMTESDVPSKAVFKGEIGQVIQGKQEVNAPLAISMGDGRKSKKQ